LAVGSEPARGQESSLNFHQPLIERCGIRELLDAADAVGALDQELVPAIRAIARFAPDKLPALLKKRNHGQSLLQ
jgi:hypothetical protein